MSYATVQDLLSMYPGHYLRPMGRDEIMDRETDWLVPTGSMFSASDPDCHLERVNLLHGKDFSKAGSGFRICLRLTLRDNDAVPENPV